MIRYYESLQRAVKANFLNPNIVCIVNTHILGQNLVTGEYCIFHFVDNFADGFKYYSNKAEFLEVLNRLILKEIG